MSLLSAGEHFMAQEVAWDPTGRYVATIVNAAAAMENGFQVRWRPGCACVLGWAGLRWRGVGWARAAPGPRGCAGGPAHACALAALSQHRCCPASPSPVPHPHCFFYFLWLQIWSFSGQPLYKTPHDRFFQLCWRPRPPSLLPEEKQRDITKNLRRYSKRYEEEDEALLAQVRGCRGVGAGAYAWEGCVGCACAPLCGYPRAQPCTASRGGVGGWRRAGAPGHRAPPPAAP